jgi:hypothetical protein
MLKMSVAVVIVLMQVSSAQTTAASPKNESPATTCQPTLLILPGGALATKSCDGAVKPLDLPTPSNPPSLSPSPTAAVSLSPNVLREQESYVIWSFQQSRKIYEWQHDSSIVIFVLVILLVLAGIYFAAIQFHYSLGSKVGSEAKKPEATEIDASLKGLKVKSPVLGVIVLAISMAFLYLYLVHVYPIGEPTAAPKESLQLTKGQ